MAKQPTLVEIAKLSGVTASTVSQMLTGNYGPNFSVRPHVRDRILEVAAHLNYKPNLAARSLSKKNTNLIAIAGSDFLIDSAELYHTALQSIAKELKKHHYDLLITVPSENASELPPWRVDGVILIQACLEATMTELKDFSYPCVILNGINMEEDIPCVVFDDAGGMHLAVEHLTGMGHRKIAYFVGSSVLETVHYSYQGRAKAYTQEMQTLGLEPMICDKLEPPTYYQRLAEAANAGITAVICYSHYEAMWLIKFAASLGIKIPQDMSMINFNDVFPCSHLNPSLTTVDTCIGEAAKYAAQRLLQLIDNQFPQGRLLTVPEALIIRQSTAPPANTKNL